MVVKGFEALHDGVMLAHLHYSNFIFNRLSLLVILGLSELKSKQLAVCIALATENASEAPCALFANNLIVLGRIFLLDVGGMRNAPRNLSTVFQSLLWLVHLTEDDLEKCAWVLRYLLLTKDTHLNL